MNSVFKALILSTLFKNPPISIIFFVFIFLFSSFSEELKFPVFTTDGAVFYGKKTEEQATCKKDEKHGESSEEGEEDHKIEFEGGISLDATIDPDDIRNPSVEIGEVALSVNFTLSDKINAVIALVAEGNLSQVGIDEAFIEWHLCKLPITVIIGQHGFNHGLLESGLLSDPIIGEVFEFAAPGITCNYEIGPLTPGLGVGFIPGAHEAEEEEEESENTRSMPTPDKNYFKGICNLDIAFLEESMSRLSFAFTKQTIDAALGIALGIDPITLSFEVFSELLANDDDALAFGGYTGVSYNANDRGSLSLRYDLLSEEDFENFTHRFGISPSINLFDDLSLTIEYSLTKEEEKDPTNEIAVSLGLEFGVGIK